MGLSLDGSDEVSWTTYVGFGLWLGIRAISIGIGLLVPIAIVWQRLSLSPLLGAISLFVVFLGLPTSAATIYLNSVTSIGYGNDFVILKSKMKEEILRSTAVSKVGISNAIVGCYLTVRRVDGRHRRIWLPRDLVGEDFLGKLEKTLRLDASQDV